jgi:hypothetical protein
MNQIESTISSSPPQDNFVYGDTGLLQSAIVVQPADIRPLGRMALQAAFRRAVERVERQALMETRR